MGGLILLGMMGSGKTTIGRRAAELVGVPFEDTDQILVRRLGRPVHQLFDLYGEHAFRGHETAVLANLEPQRIILATGGGIVTQKDNWPHLTRLGTTVYLEVSYDILVSRLSAAKKRRPLLEVEGWEDRLKNLLEARIPLYQQAEKVLTIKDDEIDTVAQNLLDLVGWSQ